MEAFGAIGGVIVFVIGLIFAIAAIFVPINIWAIKSLLKKYIEDKEKQDKFVNYTNKQILEAIQGVQANTFNLEEN